MRHTSALNWYSFINEGFCSRSRHAKKITAGICLIFKDYFLRNASVYKDFLNDLPDRGLRIDDEVLCVMDGSKGFRKAVERVFGGKVGAACVGVPDGKSEENGAKLGQRVAETAKKLSKP